MHDVISDARVATLHLLVEVRLLQAVVCLSMWKWVSIRPESDQQVVQFELVTSSVSEAEAQIHTCRKQGFIQEFRTIVVGSLIH